MTGRPPVASLGDIKIPPHNYEMEKSLLGSAMLREECLMSMLNSVRADDFFHPVNRKIFETIQNLFNSGVHPAEDAVMESLLRSGQLQSMGGPSAITSCIVNTAPTLKRTEFFVAKIIELANFRRVMNLGRELGEKGCEADGESNEIIGYAMNELIDLSSREMTSKSMTISEAMKASDEYFRKVESGELPPTMRTGFKRLDKIVMFHPGDVWVVGARPSHGKTAFAVNVATNVCRGGGKVIFVTTEMSPIQMAHRFAALTAKISSTAFRFGRVRQMASSSQFDEIRGFDDRLVIVPLFGGTESDLGLAIRRELMRMKQASLVVIDYLQLIEYSKSRGDLRISGTKVSNYIKRLAGILNLRILLLSQLSRPQTGERKKNPRPTMYDLKETGAIEQDADNITLIWPQGNEDELKEWSEWECKFLMDKSRNGATGSFDMLFRKEIGEFSDSDIPPS